MERQEIRLRLAELDSDDWVGDEQPLTVHEKSLLEARLTTRKIRKAAVPEKMFSVKFEPALAGSRADSRRLVFRADAKTDLLMVGSQQILGISLKEMFKTERPTLAGFAKGRVEDLPTDT